MRASLLAEGILTTIGASRARTLSTRLSLQTWLPQRRFRACLFELLPSAQLSGEVPAQ